MFSPTRTAVRGVLAAAVLSLGCTTLAPSPPETPRAPEPGPAPSDTGEWQRLRVTATAYNSVPSQGVGDGTVAAWGDRLEPGMKSIAISRDLEDLGLTHGVRVEIEGLDGVYTVRDRTAARWSRRIDIYMGRDVSAARAWGKREVWIRWKS